MRLYRIAPVEYDTPLAAFSGQGAAKYGGRWSNPGYRVVYCSDSLALGCLETLVHIRPLPRKFPPSIFYLVDVPDEHTELLASLPDGWNTPVATPASREHGTAFLRARRAVALVVPTTVLPLGSNALLNPVHSAFRLNWVSGPFPFVYDPRLE